MSLAEQLITRGWTKGASRDAEGRVCLMGALACETYMQLPIVGVPTREFTVGREILNDMCGRWVMSFNDDPFTTYDDVLRVAKEFDEVVDWMKEMNGE